MKKQHNKLLLTEFRTSDKIEKSQMTNQEKTALNKGVDKV